MVRWAIGGLVGALASVAAPSFVEACGPPQPLAPVGLPRAGTTGVSTATSIVVFGRGQPTGFSLQAGGQTIALDTPVELGSGADAASGPVTFWRVRPATMDGFLVASSEQVLTATSQSGPVQVTSFTTGPGYDKAEGVAPVVNAMHLWRVRYPVADINSGNCVFAEYHGFITVDYVPGSAPNTASDSVVHAFSLAPKNGGSAQSFLYTGATPFVGLEPKGAYPTPTGLWHPELDPTREYCLAISAFGDGDIARLPASSQPICAQVVQLSVAGAPPPGGAGGGGCTIGTPPDGLPRAWPLAIAVAVVIVIRRRGRRR
jgi:hypothetical protein